MEEIIEIQQCLYNNKLDLLPCFCSDYSVLIDEIVFAPSIRPFLINDIVDWCVKHKDSFPDGFKCYLLKAGLRNCPSLVRKLMQKGYFCADEILDRLSYIRIRGLCFYFFEIINDYAGFVKNFRYKYSKYGFESFPVEEEKESNSFLLDYGFPKNSIEYALKYDDSSILNVYESDPSFSYSSNIKWSQFEWAFEPYSMDPLSVSAFFGSVKCFKRIMILSSATMASTMYCALCGGNIDIVSMISENHYIQKEAIDITIKYCQEVLFDWLCSNTTLSTICASESHCIKCYQFLIGNGMDKNSGFNVFCLYKLLLNIF